MENFDRANV